MTPPAIVIAAHNRPHSLERLLASVLRADITEGTPLTVSIDGGGDHQARISAIARAIDWPHGPLEVLEHHHHGLVGHFLTCGDMTERFGSIVMLEDDLVVGPAFQAWAQAALTHASSDQRIAGVSMATPGFDGFRHLPFEPVDDGSDGIYAQIPWYDGMAWTAPMWREFRNHDIAPSTHIHRSFDELNEDEWFPDAVRYLVESGRYYLLPRHAHASNTGAAGAHFSSATDYFQVPLTMREPAPWRLLGLSTSLAIYDDHMELSPLAVARLCERLDRDVACDLLGMRDLENITADFVLTTRQTTNAIQTWGAAMHPLILNVVFDAPGDTIALSHRDDVKITPASDTRSSTALRAHANHNQTPSPRHAVRDLTAGLKEKFSRG